MQKCFKTEKRIRLGLWGLAGELIAAYPECPAADALRSVLSLAEPEFLDPGLKEELRRKLSEMLKLSGHRAVYGRE